MSALAAPARSVATAQGGWMQREQAMMGVRVGVQLWADDRTRGAAAIAAVMAEMQRVDRRYSASRTDSELALVNAAAATRAVRVSDECFQLLVRAQEFSRLTQGAFDVTRDHAGPPPGADGAGFGAARSLPAIGWRQLQFDAMVPSVRFAGAGLSIDLGGFARAHALERSVALLRRHGIRHARVAAGADVRLLGDRRGQAWTEGIGAGIVADRAPPLPLQDQALSTAVAAPGRASVVAADSLSAHALARALLVLGVERGLRLAEQQGVEALIVDGDGRLHASRDGQAVPDQAGAAARRASA